MELTNGYIQFYNGINKAALRYGKFKTFDEKEEQQYTGVELEAQISSIANLNGNEYQKAKHLFHERMIKNNYVPLSPNLFEILTSNSDKQVSLSYKDLVHNQEIIVKFCLFSDVTKISFLRPYSNTAAGLYIDFFYRLDKNDEKNLIRLLKKIDTLIFNMQKKPFMPKDNHMQNQNHQQLVKSEIKSEIDSDDEDPY